MGKLTYASCKLHPDYDLKQARRQNQALAGDTGMHAFFVSETRHIQTSFSGALLKPCPVAGGPVREKSMRHWIFAFSLLTACVPVTMAQISVGVALPGVNIGINVPVYPEMVQIPDYPVYYAPRLQANFFLYDGLYWVYQGDNWYASSWYNGPWWYVPPEAIPIFVLQIPIRYYRSPPYYFRNWHPDSSPRWGEHWGSGWEQQRRNWDRQHLNGQRVPAPLPYYQHRFPAQRYPSQQEQQRLQEKNYRHRPSDPEVRQHFGERGENKGPFANQNSQQNREHARDREQNREQNREKNREQNRAPERERGSHGRDH